MATHSSIRPWKIPRTEEPGRLQSLGSQRVDYDWATIQACMHAWSGKWEKWELFYSFQSNKWFKKLMLLFIWKIFFWVMWFLKLMVFLMYWCLTLFFFVLFVCSENCFQGLGDMKSVHLHCWNVAVLCVAGKDAVLFSFLKIFWEEIQVISCSHFC